MLYVRDFIIILCIYNIMIHIVDNKYYKDIFFSNINLL
jgi:hypothetical protein